jgi:hypothetical protein
MRSQFQALCVVVKQTATGSGQCNKYGEYEMVKTERNIVEANFTHKGAIPSGAILTDQSTGVEGISPSYFGRSQIPLHPSSPRFSLWMEYPLREGDDDYL